MLLSQDLSSSSSASSSSTSLPQDSSSSSESSKTAKWQYPRSTIGKPRRPSHQKKKGNRQAPMSRLRDLPEWSEEFTENLEDTEVPALANTSQDSDSERLTTVATRKHSIFYSLSQEPKLRSEQANQDFEGFLQEAHWRNSTSGRQLL